MSSSYLHFASITQKIWMAFLGAFLMIFLLIHLGINLFLLRQDDGQWFNAAAHFMGTNYVVKVLEVILFAGFIFHILLGIILQLKNWISRPIRYHVTNKTTTPFLSKYMIYTGGIVLFFLIFHFTNFYFIRLGWVGENAPRIDGEPNFYIIAHRLFSIPGYSILYISLFIVLGFHLYHAFESAFQSLGLNIKKYTQTIEKAGLIYSIIVPAGFIIIPLFILFIR